MKKISSLLAIISLTVLQLAAQETKPIALVNVHVVDVEAGKLLKNRIVIISNDRISDIIPFNKIVNLSRYEVVQGNGNYLMPGLIDTHLHLYYYLKSNRRDLLKLSFKLMLINGVTGMREAGASVYTEEMIAVRDSLAKKYFPGPRMYVSGIATASNLKKFQTKNYSELVDTFGKIGVDGIKIKFATWSEARQIIDAAKKKGLSVYGHTSNVWNNETSNLQGDFTMDVINKGINGVMHLGGYAPVGNNPLPPGPEPVFASTSNAWDQWWLYFDALWLHTDKQAEQQLISNMISQKVWLEPTFSIGSFPMNYQQVMKKKALQYYFYPDSTLIEGFPHPEDAWLDTARMAFRRTQEFVKKFYSAGGLVLAGTDGSLYGSDLRDELRYLVQAGIPTAAVLKIATYNNALALGWLNDLGTVSKGKLANLILLGKNPLLDIDNLENVVGIFSNGIYYPEQTIQSWLSEISETASKEKNGK